MATLLQSLQPKLGGSTALPGTQLGQTQGLRSLVQTSTGKAPTGDQGPQQADIGELQAARETRLQGQGQALAEQIQTSQAQGQSEAVETQQEQQLQTLGEKVRDNQAQFEIRANSIISDYTNQGRKIDTLKDVAVMEQAGAALRLSNEQYVTELNRAGEMARLQNTQGFREQAYREEFLQDIILAKDNNTFRQIMDADHRTFAWAMEQMDIDFALEVADQARKQANSMAVMKGVGGILSAGAKAAASKEAGSWFKKTPTTAGSTSLNTRESAPGSMVPKHETEDPATGLKYNAATDIWS